MTAALDWETDGKDWPHRAASRFVTAKGVRWHVQVMGKGPALLLLHGTGASTHSWRDVMPLLAERFTVVAPDPPGHAFTSRPASEGQSLPGVAAGIAGLLKALDIAPRRAAGHSAGAAVLVRMGFEKLIRPDAIVSFNGAFFPVESLAGQFFSPLAKLMAQTAFVPRLFSGMAQSSVDRLLKDTGSKLDEPGIAYYRRLLSDEAHVAGTLGMMAAWDLHWIGADLRALDCDLYLVKGTADGTIAPDTADRAARLAKRGKVIAMAGLGHLAHEEDPRRASEIIAEPERFAQP